MEIQISRGGFRETGRQGFYIVVVFNGMIRKTTQAFVTKRGARKEVRSWEKLGYKVTQGGELLA